MESTKTIFITGAASGIGREVARLFARRGWFTGLHDINEAPVAEVALEIGADQCCWSVLDVCDSEQWKKAVARFGERTSGRMDVLFNSAGILKMGPFMDTPLDVHLQTLRVNVAGVLTAIRAAFPLLSSTPKARVITMSSASAFYGVPDLASYSMSKFAIRGMTEALSIEFERYGIGVCDIMAPYVNTPMVTEQSYKAGTLQSLGASLSPEEVAEIIWKAAHGNRVHWVPTFRLKITALFARYFPFFERATMKFLNRHGA